MTAHALSAVAMALVAALGAWLTPGLVRRLPEPPSDSPEDSGEQDATVTGDVGAAEEAVERARGPSTTPEKPLYVDLAARPGLSRGLAVFAALAAGSIGWSLGPDPSLPMWCFLAVAGVLLSYLDWHTRLLPYPLVAPAYPVMVLLVLLAALLGDDWDELPRVGLAWVVVYAVFTLMWLVYRRGLGYGDVRLSGLLAIALGWLGWQYVVIGLYAAFVVGALLGIVLAALRIVDRKAYPFGPFLMFGTWLGAVFGAPIAAWMGWTS